MSDFLELKQVGVIVGEARSDQFFFVSRPDDYPARWEYLMVYSLEEVEGEFCEVPVVAQVEGVVAASQALSPTVDIEALNRILAAEVYDVRTWGWARVLGYLDSEGRVLQPRRAVAPGKQVYIAPKTLLEKFYSFPDDERLHVGHLITRPDVPVHLSVRGFRRHLAIIAQTGAGKSYLAGVLMEELLRKGATILVLDPHSDYVRLTMTPDGSLHELAYRITVYRHPAATGRYQNLFNLRNYEIAFTELDADDICDIAGIREDATRQRAAVRKAVEHLANTAYTPQDLLKLLENPPWKDEDGELADAAHAAARYIRYLTYLKVFGLSSTNVSELLKPAHASIIDLSGLRDDSMNYIAYTILSKVYNTVSGGLFGYPVFIVIEEAHRFVPYGEETYASAIINRIAAEGRKFGLFLILVTQRPSKIDDDSLSQCNSQIIMRLTNPEDQKAVAKSSERMSQDLLNDLPSLNQGEAVVVGEVTKVPVMMKVRPRTTMEGGADIDVVSKLREALNLVRNDKRADEEDKRRRPFKGGFEET